MVENVGQHGTMKEGHSIAESITPVYLCMAEARSLRTATESDFCVRVNTLNFQSAKIQMATFIEPTRRVATGKYFLRSQIISRLSKRA